MLPYRDSDLQSRILHLTPPPPPGAPNDPSPPNSRYNERPYIITALDQANIIAYLSRGKQVKIYDILTL